MAQPKGYAAFILFPHLKMIPPITFCETGCYPLVSVEDRKTGMDGPKTTVNGFLSLPASGQ